MLAVDHPLVSFFCSPLFYVVDCGPPVAPQRGSLETYTDTTEGSEVFYRCNQHLVPERRMNATCTDSGWRPNLTALSCTEGMCSVRYDTMSSRQASQSQNDQMCDVKSEHEAGTT